MENYEEMNPLETATEDGAVPKTAEVCAKCGAALEEGQEFCTKCGTPKKIKNVCAKCGAELQEGQDFCPKCGHKVGLAVDSNVASAIDQFNSGVAKANAKKKKTPIIIGVVLVILILAALAFKTVAPKIFVSVDELCEEGNYEKAYEKAKGEEKMQVLAENMVAYLSSKSSDSLKDPTSFSLRDAWFICTYNEENSRVGMSAVLHVSGKNSYGGNVSSYWLYVYDNDKDDFELWGTSSSLNPDKDDDDYLAGALSKVVVEDSKTKKVDKASVKNINALFKADKLDQVNMLDVDELDTSVMPKASSDDK